MNKVINVCREMFNERQYTIQDEVSFPSYHEFIGTTNKNKPISLYVIPCKLNVEVLKFFYSCKPDINHLILVHQNDVTVSVKQIIENSTKTIELFRFDELQFNLLKHVLVPEHIRVDRWKRNDKKYPILKRTDPVSRFLGFEYGDVIQINRKDGSISFRFVR